MTQQFAARERKKRAPREHSVSVYFTSSNRRHILAKNLFKSIAVLLGIAGCVEQAEQIKLDQLPAILEKLVQHKMEYNFFGINSDGIACIYFVEENGYINIEFEAMVKEQIPYIKRLKSFAQKSGYSVVDTTYGNRPKYDSDSDAPVCIIQTHANVPDAAKIGRLIMKEIFESNDSTIFEIVP